MKYLKFKPRTFTFQRYQELAARTAAPVDTEKDKFMRGVLGLLGEVGELAEHLKKHFYQGHELDMEYVRKELGDILWYLTVMVDDLDYGLDSIAVENINKLRERFPDGRFDSERSIHRGS